MINMEEKLTELSDLIVQAQKMLAEIANDEEACLKSDFSSLLIVKEALATANELICGVMFRITLRRK